MMETGENVDDFPGFNMFSDEEEEEVVGKDGAGGVLAINSY